MSHSLANKAFLGFLFLSTTIAVSSFAECSGNPTDAPTKAFVAASKNVSLQDGSWQTSQDGIVYHYTLVNNKWVIHVDSVSRIAISKATGAKKDHLQQLGMALYLRRTVEIAVQLCADKGNLAIQIVDGDLLQVKSITNGFHITGNFGGIVVDDDNVRAVN